MYCSKSGPGFHVYYVIDGKVYESVSLPNTATKYSRFTHVPPGYEWTHGLTEDQAAMVVKSSNKPRPAAKYEVGQTVKMRSKTLYNETEA